MGFTILSIGAVLLAMWGGGESHPSVTFSVLIWRESCSHDIVIWAEWKRWGVIYISFIRSLTQTVLSAHHELQTRMMRLLPSHCVSDENLFHVLFLIFCFHTSSHNSQQRSHDTQSVSTKSFYFYFPTFPHKIFLLFVPTWGNLSSTSATEHQERLDPKQCFPTKCIQSPYLQMISLSYCM